MMPRGRRASFSCLIVLVAAACAADHSTQGIPSMLGISEGVSGTLIPVAGGTLQFQACNADDAMPVVDATGEDLVAVVEELGYGSQAVNAHLVLDGERVSELRIAAPEVPSCLDILPDTELEARGNEPFWNVRIDGSEALFRSPEELAGVRYEDGTWEEAANGWRFRAVRADAASDESLTIEFSPDRCIDTMSGARYPFRAVLDRDGSRAEGCALEGRRLWPTSRR